MEDLVANILTQNNISFAEQVSYSKFPEIVKALGSDRKRFDFVVKSKGVNYLIEVNFYSTGGSKLNEVARAYTELASKINAVPGYELVWITDGIGWQDARNKIEEAFNTIPNIYNLNNIDTFIEKIK